MDDGRKRIWEGGIIYAAQQVVLKEKVLVFTDEALANENEVHATLTKILRGEPVGGVEASPKYEHVLSACKLLQDKFNEEKKMLSGGKGGSIILQMNQGSVSQSTGQITGSVQPSIDNMATSTLKQLTASIDNIHKADSIDPEELARANDEDGLLALFDSVNVVDNNNEEEEEQFDE